MVWAAIVIGLAVVTATAIILSRRLGLKEGVQLTSTLVATASTVVLGVFAWEHMIEAKRLQATEYTAKWGELRNAMWEVLDSYPPSGVEALRSFSIEQRVAWFRQLRRLLDSQIGNPVLIEDEESLGHWRNAISSAKTSIDVVARTGGSEVDALLMASARSILSDVLFVWQKLVLRSNEVSPTGGRPKPR